ncbi:ribose 5-phosphate isomerase B [Aerococcus urinaeequi]|uniref:ribose 5-phosphate isomerase B n=1 Tax=Aerococcus urinaeequi TaxID=51665 RepID=UPI000845EAA7|nr:ribose 5-phosphate isomerase B [Aerococcus urinaeequi]
MKVSIGADHGGFELKEKVISHLIDQGIDVTDQGTYGTDSVDFPDYSKKVTEDVQNKISDLGILICGTGIGMSIAANKQKGVRAALVGDVFSAKATREHNNSNVLCLGARVTGEGLALMIVDTWLNAEFEGGRHENRIAKIEEL